MAKGEWTLFIGGSSRRGRPDASAMASLRQPFAAFSCQLRKARPRTHQGPCISVVPGNSARPGCGLSDRPRAVPDHTTVAAYVSRLTVDILDALRLHTVSLVGSSFGGYQALRTAAQQPDPVDRLVRAGCPAFVPGWTAPKFFDLLRTPVVGRLLLTLRPTGSTGASRRETVAVRVIDDVRDRSRQRFVGRAPELERFRAVLAAGRSQVVWVFGAGGVGKTTLLDAFAHEASNRGRATLTVDLRSVEQPRATLEAARTRWDETPPRDAPVLLIDAFERSDALERWLRDEFVAELPTGTVLVVAGRTPPSVEWRSDPIWSAALDLMPLRSLSTTEAAELLARLDVPTSMQPETIRLSGGHPLALSLLAQFIVSSERKDLPADLTGAPDLVGTLLERLVDDVPSPRHRRGLETITLARVSNRSLLRAVVGDADEDAVDDVFAWLEAQPYVDRVDDGVCPHDLARDLFEADLRCDPDRYAEVNRTIRSFLLERDRLRRSPDRNVKDFIFLHRASSLLSGYWDWATYDSSEATELRDGDGDALTAITLAHDSPAAAACMDHWIDRQPDAFTIVRSSAGEVLGVVALLVLADPEPADLVADPAIAAVWAHAERARPRRAGEVIGVLRFFDDAQAGQAVSPTFNVVTLRSTRHWLLTEGLTLDYILLRDPDAWAPMMSYVDFHDAGFDVSIGGVAHRAFVHDWREVPLDAWLDRMELLETGGPIPTRPTAAPVLVALSHDEFTAAVRAALRDLSRPSRLATNPLVRSRVSRDVADSDEAQAIDRAVRDAFEALPDDPRTERARRAVARTYLHGAVSQEAAAEVLGMAFSTYRRHLAAGVDLLVDQLWRWELYGRGG